MIRTSVLALLVLVLRPATLAAQQPQSQGLGAPAAPVAVLATALYNDQANLREASDSAKAGFATTILRTRLQEGLGAQLIAYAVLDSLATAPAAMEMTGHAACNVMVACARAIAAQTGARWVVLSKVGKTSNLIWLLTAQLIRTDTGDIILDDSTELKGDPDVMIRVGVRNFADRVTRTVRNGGIATDFPPPPASP